MSPAVCRPGPQAISMPLSAQAVRAAHHAVDVRHVVGDVVERRRAGQQRDAVMRRVAAQEAHEVAEPVRHLEAEHVGEPLDQRLVIGRVEHDVADPERQAFPAPDFAALAARHVARNLQLQSVRRKEAEAVAAAGCVELVRLANDLCAGFAHLLAQHSTSARSSAASAITSTRFSAALRRRTTWCSSCPGALNHAMPSSLGTGSSPQTSS